MKRQGNLIASIASYENCLYAVSRAARGKAERPEIVAFRTHLNQEIEFLQSSILMGKMFPFEYRSFSIADPKPRIIQVAPFRVRVMHHAIMNVMGEMLEKRQYAHSYACMNGRGTHAAIRYVQSTIDTNHGYLKMDIRKFFDSISHDILFDQMLRITKDEKLLLLLRDIIDGYETKANCGLPIGNLTSQYLANHYLTPLDRFIKQELKVKYYVRYMDDMLIYNMAMADLKIIRGQIESFVNHQLRLCFKVSQINWISRGIPFLGMRIFPNKIRLSAVATRRFMKRWRMLSDLWVRGLISEREAAIRLNAVMAFAMNAQTVALRNKLMLDLEY